MKRECGKVSDGIEAATAPATVTGELSFNEPLIAQCDREGERPSSDPEVRRPTSYLINVARGECVDEAALVHALESGVIAGYASDNHGGASGELTGDTLEILSPESELWGLENVIITPNCAEAGPRRYVYMAEIIANNYRDLLTGVSPRTRLVWNGVAV